MKKVEVKKVINFEFIDLGLSVKWANMNVGSNKMEEYGKYFCWDEVIGDKHVDWEE